MRFRGDLNSGVLLNNGESVTLTGTTLGETLTITRTGNSFDFVGTGGQVVTYLSGAADDNGSTDADPIDFTLSPSAGTTVSNAGAVTVAY